MILSQMKSCRCLAGRVLDVLVHQAKLGHRGHVETRAGFVKRLDDRRIGIRLHRVVRLHARQVLLERRVVLAQFVVVDDEQRRAVFLGQFLEHARCEITNCGLPPGSS